MKRVLSLVLALVLTVSCFGITAQAATTENEALKAEIKRQLDTYADTVDVEDAGSEATSILLDHAMNGNGEDLIAEAGHPLNAAVLNSASYSVGFSRAVAKYMMEGVDSVYLVGGHSWYTSKVPQYSYKPEGSTKYTVSGKFNGELNDYDKALAPVVGGTRSRIYLQKANVTDRETTYYALIMMFDDFDAANSDYDHWKDSVAAPQEILTMLAKLLEKGGVIEPFRWYTYAILPLTIPNELLASDGTGDTEPEIPAEPEAPEASVPDGSAAIANYAASVTPANAAEDAQKIIFGHAFTGKGADLNLPSGSPVTGTVLSSGLFQHVFAEAYEDFVASGRDSAKVRNVLAYYAGSRTYRHLVCDLYQDADTGYSYTGPVNGYDEALINAAGSLHVTIVFSKTAAANGEIFYHADISMTDYFDTDYDGSDSSLKDIILTGGAAALAFLNALEPFNWYAEASFTLNDYA